MAPEITGNDSRETVGYSNDTDHNADNADSNADNADSNADNADKGKEIEKINKIVCEEKCKCLPEGGPCVNFRHEKKITGSFG